MRYVRLVAFGTPVSDDMTVLLSKAGSNLTVKQLLDTLQEILDFEASLSKKYAIQVSQRCLLRILRRC